VTGNEIFIGCLDRYCSQSETPGFAVMIHGPWGSGKTHFVKDYIRRSKAKESFRYISLYGVSSAEEIDSAFIASLYDVWNNAVGRFVVTVLSGVMELICRTNLSRALAEGLSADNTQSSFASKYLAKIRKNVFVFDDIERAKLPLGVALGRINKLVEHVGCKVLIVSQTDFKDVPKNAKQFEKLIGYSFRVIPEHKALIDDIKANVQRSEVPNILNRNAGIVETTFRLSKYDNLRIMRRIVASYLTVLEKLPESLLQNSELMDAMFREYLPIAYELKMGNLSEDEVSKFERGQSFYVVKSDDTPWAKLASKYNEVLPARLLLLGETWKKIICDGFVDLPSIEDDLQTTVYGSKQEAPVWKRLMNIWDMTDDEFDALINEAKTKIESHEYVVAGELLHVFTMLCYLEKRSINVFPRGVESFAKDYVSGLVERGTLVSNWTNEKHFLETNTYGGYMYLTDVPEYATLKALLKDGLHAIEARALPAIASDWFARFEESPPVAMAELVNGRGPQGRYADVPVLTAVDPAVFAQKYASLPPEIRREVLSCLRARYEYAHSDGRVLGEARWLQLVAEHLQEEVVAREGKLSGLQLNNEYEKGFLLLAQNVESRKVPEG
jgi:hypothetical protein